MARKPVFTEQNVIDAVQALNEKNKTINGTNLRLEIGSGSPQKLLDTYNNLLAKGKVENKNLSQIESLEVQLEKSLEELSRAEELLETSQCINQLLCSLFIEASMNMYSDPDWIENLGNPYSKLLDVFCSEIKSLGLSLLTDNLFEIYRFVLDGELEILASSFRHDSNEIKSLKISLAEAVYKRKSIGIGEPESSEEIEIKKRIEQEYNKKNRSLEDVLSDLDG